MTVCPRKIARIRTGGQSGVDRAALRDYPELQETPISGTEQRTRWNMRDAGVILTTIPEGSAKSQGTQVGLEEGEHLGKPMFTAAGLKDVPEILRWISTLPDGTELCVGGPRASECPEVYETAKAVLAEYRR